MNARDARHALHYLISAYLVLGWIPGNCTWLRIHFWVCVGTILHWLTNNNRCFLAEYDYDGGHGAEYTQHMLRAVGIHLPKVWMVVCVAYLVVILPALASFAKSRAC